MTLCLWLLALGLTLILSGLADRTGGDFIRPMLSSGGDIVLALPCPVRLLCQIALCCSILAKAQNHRISWVGRSPQGSSSPTPGPGQDDPNQPPAYRSWEGILSQPADLVAALVEGISNHDSKPAVAAAGRCWAAGFCCWGVAAALLVCSFTRKHVPFHLENVQNKAGDNKKN